MNVRVRVPLPAPFFSTVPPRYGIIHLMNKRRLEEESGKGRVFFVSGIDTDVGKTVVTGLMARALVAAGIDAITVKMVQTGC